MSTRHLSRTRFKRGGIGVLISTLLLSALSVASIPKATAADFWTSCNTGLQYTSSTYVTVDSTVSGKCIITFKLGQTFTLPAGVSSLSEILAVGGGGGGGFNNNGGGGGAGQVQHRNTALTLGTATQLVITIGAGGTDGWITSSNWTKGENGSPTEIKTQAGTRIIRAGGGGGGCGGSVYATGYEGSGGGSCTNGASQAGSTANATAGFNAYTNAGRAGTAGGGGGAGAAATSSQGGAGVTLFGLTVGGGGGGWGSPYTGGSGGGGTSISGSSYTYTDRDNGSDGVANTGGGGGAARNGGSGVVKIAYLIPTAKAPSAPTSVSATAEVLGLTVNWGAPTDLGQRTVTGYQVEYSTTGASGSWTVASSSISAASTSYKITDLNGQTAYFVRVAAKYSGGLGAYGYPWIKIYETVTPYRTSNLITYVSGYGLTGGAAATNASTAFSRVRYVMASTYDGAAKYVDADFYRTLASTSSSSGTFDSISKLQVPTISGTGSQFVIQGNVSDLTVLSNTSEVQSGNGFTGRLEIWPWDYGTSAANDQAERSAGTYDDSDTQNAGGSYGSFQLHNLTSTTKQTAFSWNNHGQTTAFDLGFGNPPSGQSDWTFCARDLICTSRTAFSLGVYINAPTTTLAGPTITSLSVTTGNTTGGTATVLTGTNLTGTTGVTVDGVAATLGTITSTSVAITTPAGTAGVKDVVLTTPSGSVTSTGAFTYTRVNQATLNISAATSSATSNGTGYSATPTFSTTGGTGTGTVTYAVAIGGTASSCTLSNGTASATLTATTSGTCLIKASKAEDNTYNVASSSNLTFTFNKLALTTPTNVAATATSLKAVTVSWTGVANASSYTVLLYDSTGATVRATKTGVISPTSYTFTDSDYLEFSDATEYKTSVTAVASGDFYRDSSESTKVSITSSAALAVPSSVSAQPTGTSPNGTRKSIDVTWGAVANVSSYTVKIYDVATGGTPLATVTGILSSATSTTLTTSQYPSMLDKTTYYITVTAVGNGTTYLTSVESSRASVTTHAIASTPSFSVNPSSQSKTAGQSVTFTVSATATDLGTLSYVWKKGSTTVGTNSSTYTIPTTATSDQADYTVVVTNTLNGGTSSSTSAAATLTMYSALAFNARGNVTITAGTALAGGTSILVTAINGRANRTYALSAGSLPIGLSLDSATGAITGTPTVAGTYSGTKITVTDANGATLEMASGFTITVNRGSQLPISIVTRYGTGGQTLNLAIQGGSGSGTLTFAETPDSPYCSISGSTLTANFGVGVSGICNVTATRAADLGFTASSSSSTAIFFTAYVPVAVQSMTCPAGTVPSNPTGIGVGTCMQVLAPVSTSSGDAGAAPKITALSLATAAVGAQVVITGTGFSSATKVQFGSKSTTTFTKTSTTITVNVPTGATSGRVMVFSPTGTAMASQIFTVITSDVRAPAYLSGNINTSVPTQVTLNFDENLASSGISASAFGVSVAGLSRTVNSVSISGSTITLTLASAVSTGQTVLFTYTSPGDSTSIQDAAGNKTGTIVATALTNTL